MPGTPRTAAAARAFTDPRTFATTLITLVLDEFGAEALAWHPATLKMEVEETFGVNLPPITYDRLMTAVLLVNTDLFYKSPPEFVWMCNVLSGDGHDPTTFEPAEAEEIAWGVTEALLLSPPDDDDPEPFVEETRAYIGAALDREGILSPPDVLRLALRPGDRAGEVRAMYADQPQMYGAIREVEDARKRELNEIVKGGLRNLIAQLQGLELQAGDARQLLERLTPPTEERPWP